MTPFGPYGSFADNNDFLSAMERQMVSDHAGSEEGFHLVPVTLFDQAVPAVEVRVPEGWTLEFELAKGPLVPPGDRLLDLLVLVRRAVHAGHLVLVRGLRVHQAGRISDDMPHTFVWSIGDCAGLLLQASGMGPPSIVMPQSPVNYKAADLLRDLADQGLVQDRSSAYENAARIAYRTSGHQLLVGSRSAVRFMCSYLEPTPSPQAIIESPPVCINYGDFASLWTDSAQIMEDEATDGFRWLSMIALGKGLGEAHSNGILHGDAHEGNLPVDPIKGVTFIDTGRARFLYGPAESAECATDLLPLLRGFTGWDWYNFKRGYLQSWPAGGRVFDLIEHGDRTGWMQASRRQNYQLTLDLLDEAQQLMDVDAVVDLAYLTDMRAWCHLNLAQHELALRAETDAIALAEENRLPEVSRYILNSVLIHREMGHADLAVSILKDFLARTDHAADNEQIVEKGRQLMDMLRTEGVHGLRRFLTRYRPGHVPWARRAHQ